MVTTPDAPGLQQFRKKPVVIEAVQFTREMAEGSVPLPIGVVMGSRSLGPDGRFPEYANDGVYLTNYSTQHRHFIVTLEGTMDVQIGDWIITGVKGEHYPCKPDIFAATYESADTPSARPLPSDWVAVPREPTTEMQVAGWGAHWHDTNSRDVWAAMIAAAPKSALGETASQERARLLVPVLKRSAEYWGNHHCASELARAIEIIEDLLPEAAPSAPAEGGEGRPLSERLYRGPAHPEAHRERFMEGSTAPEPLAQGVAVGEVGIEGNFIQYAIDDRTGRPYEFAPGTKLYASPQPAADEEVRGLERDYFCEKHGHMYAAGCAECEADIAMLSEEPNPPQPSASVGTTEIPITQAWAMVDELVEAAVGLESAEASRCPGENTNLQKERLAAAREAIVYALTTAAGDGEVGNG